MSEIETNKKHIKMENLSVNKLRQRLFVKKATFLNPKAEYTYLDDVPEQIEALEGFTTWEQFADVWDVLWVGLDPRTLNWVPGRHNSPMRRVVAPVSVVLLDEKTKRMQVPSELRQIIHKMEVPVKQPIPESEVDRIISDKLSGREPVKEAEGDKAIELLTDQLSQLQEQLDILVRAKNKK